MTYTTEDYEKLDRKICRALVMLASPQATPKQRDEAMRTLWKPLRIYSGKNANRQPGRDVDDAHQTLMVKILEVAHRYDAQRPPRAWLKGVAFNTARQAFTQGETEVRRIGYKGVKDAGRPALVMMEDIWQTRERQGDGENDAVIKAGLTVDRTSQNVLAKLVKRETSDMLLDELRSILSPQEFFAFVRAYGDEYSYEEIAEQWSVARFTFEGSWALRNKVTAKSIDNAISRAKRKIEEAHGLKMSGLKKIAGASTVVAE